MAFVVSTMVVPDAAGVERELLIMENDSNGERVMGYALFDATHVPISSANRLPIADADALAKLELIRALLAGTVTVSLPSGAATSALQGTANTSLAAIQTAVQLIDNAVGAQAKTSSLSVTTATDQYDHMPISRAWGNLAAGASEEIFNTQLAGTIDKLWLNAKHDELVQVQIKKFSGPGGTGADFIYLPNLNASSSGNAHTKKARDMGGRMPYWEIIEDDAAASNFIIQTYERIPLPYGGIVTLSNGGGSGYNAEVKGEYSVGVL